MANSGVVFSWGKSITRSHSIASELGFSDIHIYPKYSTVWGKFLNYLSAFIKQFILIARNDYDAVVVVAPPVFSLYSAVIARLFCKKKFKIIYDCHNGVLRSDWKYWPFLKFFAQRADVVLCHNNVVKPFVDELYGVDAKILLDPLVSLENIDLDFMDSSGFIDETKINVLVPVSYADDEPIDEIIQAAFELGNSYNFILTGDYTKKYDMVDEYPVTFTGYISNVLYFKLMKDADAVLCLTSNDAIQMCAMIEAISFYQRAIATNNSVNKTLFSKYVWRLCDNETLSIVGAVSALTKTVADGDKLEKAISDYKKLWREDAYEIF